jgi:hypothetical protein
MNNAMDHTECTNDGEYLHLLISFSDEEMTDLSLDTSCYDMIQAFDKSSNSSVVSEALLHQDSIDSSNCLQSQTSYDASPPVFLRSLSNFVILHRHQIPNSHPASAPPTSKMKVQNQRCLHTLNGWRMGVFVSCIGVSLCLMFEVGLLIAAVAIGRPANGLGLLLEGSCGKVKLCSVLLLLPFNVIGTVMIGCSNYVMQCLSAPTRKDIDAAHAKGYDLNIGVSSLQNLDHIPLTRLISWWVLGLSTIPIHLLLNSIIITSLQANNYDVVIVSSNFQTDPSWPVCSNLYESNSYQICSLRENTIKSPQVFRNLTTNECIGQYMSSIQTSATNVFLVTKESNRQWNQQNNSLFSSDDPLWEVASFRSAFSAFDYASETGELDFGNSSIPGSLWRPNSWICPYQTVNMSRECTISTVPSRSFQSTIA